jgi:hypothetical protein
LAILLELLTEIGAGIRREKYSSLEIKSQLSGLKILPSVVIVSSVEWMA